MAGLLDLLLNTGNAQKRCLFLRADDGTAEEKSQIDPYAEESKPQDTILVQDVSYSMEETDCLPSRLDASKAAAQEYVKSRAQISPDDRVAIVAFASNAEISMQFTFINEMESIVEAIRNLRLDCGTDIAAGLEMAARLKKTYCCFDSRRICRILLLTDGHGGRPLYIAKKLKKAGAIIEVIGVGGDPSAVDESLLREVATTDAQGVTHYRFISDAQSLIQHYRRMANSLVWKENNS
jgi:Ca-activated chloride channel family protein